MQQTKLMSKRELTLTAIILTLMSPAILATGAFAQPPSNDDFDNATVIPSLPFSDSISTVEATTAADDPDCFGNGHSVWYSFTPDEDVLVTAFASGSGYAATLSVYTGSRGGLEQIDCEATPAGNTSVHIRFDAIAGETYYFMVASSGEQGDSGGNLVFNVEGAQPFDVEISIDPTGKVSPSTGLVTVSGTVSCSGPSGEFQVSGDATQRAGRVTIQGSFIEGFFSCTGGEEPTPWSATFEGDNGRFVAGRASVTVSAFGCGPDTCDFDEESRTVRLRG